MIESAGMLNKRLIVGLGYEKCGTTSAHAVLARSPLVSISARKETFFFNRDHQKGLDYYLSLFDGKEDAKFMLDITPSYHKKRDTYKRINEVAPDSLIVLFIRDPIRRAFSLYWHDITHHHASGQRAIGPNGELFQKPFRRTFLDVSRRYNNYFVNLSDSIFGIYRSFSRDRVLIVYFDEINNGTFLPRLEERLQQSLMMDRADVWRNKNVPIIYQLQMVDGEEHLVLHRGGKAISWPVQQLGWRTVCQALAASQYWSKFVSKADYDKIYDRLYRNMNFAKLGIDRDRLFEPGILSRV